MTGSDSPWLDEDASEADAVDQRIPVSYTEDDDDLESTRVRISRTSDADEADLIEQALDVPGDDEFDR